MASAPTPTRVLTLQSHLRELRRRILLICLALVIGFVIGFLLSDPLWAAIQAPIQKIGEKHSQLASVNFPTISAAFDLRIQLAITLAVIITAPFWLYQLLAFVVPGLLTRERRYLFAFLGVAVPLFLAGCFAGWWVTPHIVEVMLGFVPSNSSALIDAKTLFEFVLKLMLAIGVAFVLPVFLVILNMIGLLSGASILRSWRWRSSPSPPSPPSRPPPPTSCPCSCSRSRCACCSSRRAGSPCSTTAGRRRRPRSWA
ncbi:Twin-arginine translocation protein TatC [Microbacterium esteraromaticum]|uniref:Twin-arginine translocation protein TatC n=1 Tax=Microbacterium esteraromaticum TaxID=57043 RepID=A0A1R4K0D9_9MICO|nr:twin-arginine translocase subunit TatC [Microbacterium esteraromaticum]SJN37678.1 Twin-arginine translocation protein TatC [Microbacterium esteraromaticum]